MAKYTCDNPRPLQVCEPTPEPVVPEPCPEWEICLPFYGKLYSREGCIHHEPGNPPPDGVYSKLTIINGCIVSAEKADLAMYAGASCAPVPCACNEAGTGGGPGGSSLPEPSRNDGNLFEYDLSGRPLVRVIARGENGISVTGAGTTENPLVISAVGGESGGVIYLQAGNSSIEVTGSGTREDPYLVTHAKGHEAIINGMKFDARGHLVGFVEDSGSATGINGIKGGENIDVQLDQKTKLATVSLQPPATALSTQVSIGNTTLTISKGFLTGAVAEWLLPASVLQLGDYQVSIAEGGVIEGFVFTPEGNPVHALEKKIEEMAGETHVVAGAGIFADGYNNFRNPNSDNPLDFELDVVTAQAGSLLIEFFSDPSYQVYIPGHGDEGDRTEIVNTTPFSFGEVTVDGNSVVFSYNSDATPSQLFIPGPVSAGAHLINMNNIQFDSYYYNLSCDKRKKIPQLVKLTVVGSMSSTNTTLE